MNNPAQSCEVSICHSGGSVRPTVGLSGIFPEGFPTRFTCGNDKQTKDFTPDTEYRGIPLIKCNKVVIPAPTVGALSIGAAGMTAD